MKTILRVTLVCAILTTFASACTNTPSSPTYTPEPTHTPMPTVVEPGLAYGEPCKPPCWRGMIPGKTTRQEADQAIEQLRSSGWASDINASSNGYGIQPLPDTPEGSISVGLEDNAISEINGMVQFYYPIGTLIKQLGEPEVIHSRFGVNPRVKRYPCANANGKPPDYSTPYTLSDVLYPHQGLYFLVLVPGRAEGYICPEMKIVSFCYYPPLSLQEALNNDYLANLCGIDALKGLTEQKLVKWHGFGTGY